MKILVTGFDPFGKEEVNPAYEAVKLLSDFRFSGDVCMQQRHVQGSASGGGF